MTCTTDEAKPTTCEKETLLADYGHHWEQWRHADNLGWGAGAFLIAASFACLAASTTLANPTAGQVTAAVAVVPFLWWCLIMERLRGFCERSADQLDVLRDKLGLEATNLGPAARKKLPRVPWHVRIRVWPRFRFMWWGAFIVPCAVASGIGCAHAYGWLSDTDRTSDVTAPTP